MTARVFLISVLSVILACCSRLADSRLAAVEALSATVPEEALDSLQAIDYVSLSAADKHYYDFLSVKVADKAYIEHTSDSLIHRVIDYESRHKSNGRYPEALYYGGRVHSDLGDYPNALRYFQQANDEVPTSDIDLKYRILSQTGRLLTALRLYQEAIPYIKSTIEIEESVRDSVGMANDLILLGGTYLRNEDYKDAQHYFNQALVIGAKYPRLKAKSKMYLAAAKYKIGETDSALMLIRDTPTEVGHIVRRSALGYASNIYLKAGILDTAYMYAKELISEKKEHIAIGYQVLLSPELREYIHPDSLNEYIRDYRDILENYYDENISQLTINQQALFNYQTHEQKRIKAENANKILKTCIWGFILIILLLGVIALSLKNRNKNIIIRLHRALENISELEHSIKHAQANSTSRDSGARVSTQTSDKESIIELRERLRHKLYEIYKEHSNSGKAIPIPLSIIESPAYEQLQNLLSEKRELKENNSLWKELEETITKCSPNFKKNLQLLVGGKLTSYDLHTAILIKCGISLTSMTILLNRTKGTIVSRRESLCLRVFDEKLGTKVIDGIIRLL